MQTIFVGFLCPYANFLFLLGKFLLYFSLVFVLEQIGQIRLILFFGFLQLLLMAIHLILLKLTPLFLQPLLQFLKL